jgi:WD40 repeat protein
LIRWDINKRKPISKKKLDFPIKCLDISRGNLLAVGHKNGVVNIFDGNTMNYLKKIS